MVKRAPALSRLATLESEPHSDGPAGVRRPCPSCRVPGGPGWSPTPATAPEARPGAVPSCARRAPQAAEQAHLEPGPWGAGCGSCIPPPGPGGTCSHSPEPASLHVTNTGNSKAEGEPRSEAPGARWRHGRVPSAPPSPRSLRPPPPGGPPAPMPSAAGPSQEAARLTAVARGAGRCAPRDAGFPGTRAPGPRRVRRQADGGRRAVPQVGSEAAEWPDEAEPPPGVRRRLWRPREKPSQARALAAGKTAAALKPLSQARRSRPPLGGQKGRLAGTAAARVALRAGAGSSLSCAAPGNTPLPRFAQMPI